MSFFPSFMDDAIFTIDEETETPLEEEMTDADLLPLQDDSQFHFGVVGHEPSRFDFANVATATTSSALTIMTEDPEQQTDIYYYEIAPKQDDKQYHFGMLPAVKVNFMAVSTTTSGTSCLISPWEIDENDLVHYDLAPRQDGQQYHFGLAGKPTGFDFSLSLSLLAPVADHDDENLYHCEMATNPDANQYYFGMAPARSRRTFPTVLSTNSCADQIGHNEKILPTKVDTNQKEFQHAVGMAPQVMVAAKPLVGSRATNTAAFALVGCW